MFGLGKHGPDGRYGVIVDIGSGSVGVAIVVSDPLEKEPEILWTHREQMVLRESESQKQSTKHITTALLNTYLAIGGEGMRALQGHEKGAKIDTMQIAISAPWSYTITKTVSYERKEAFEITQRLISDLVETAEKQALEAIDESEIMRKLGLKIITKATINISANNYNTSNPYGQKAKNLAVSHVSAISQKGLLDAIQEGKSTMLPKADLELYSFMLVLYCVLQKLAPDTSEVCLIDVTSEATEIGIVRDGILKYVTHAPFGTFTIARDLSKTCNIPKDEALAYLRGNVALEKTLTPIVKEELDVVLQSYEDSIVELFKRTGDSLAIPRPLFIHTDARTEKFFSERIHSAAVRATKVEHGVHLVTKKLLGENPINDTALLLSANFFHKMRGSDNFEQV